MSLERIGPLKKLSVLILSHQFSQAFLNDSIPSLVTCHLSLVT